MEEFKTHRRGEIHKTLRKKKWLNKLNTEEKKNQVARKAREIKIKRLMCYREVDEIFSEWWKMIR